MKWTVELNTIKTTQIELLHFGAYVRHRHKRSFVWILSFLENPRMKNEWIRFLYAHAHRQIEMKFNLSRYRQNVTMSHATDRFQSHEYALWDWSSNHPQNRNFIGFSTFRIECAAPDKISFPFFPFLFVSFGLVVHIWYWCLNSTEPTVSAIIRGNKYPNKPNLMACYARNQW